ncbi:uncharacterized protein N7483_010642 [Penicillium malachiteum]|uniref:uncharacterized protein n=1 Tax=Penicillium malachiteum TaxID=1324776 RepID=UPI002548E1F1|nr:uncharacterized protein N7483_010642 [Penicillium malachiteum]KAJ5713461.1 hypothetical protein N7483_010642 [Penicillium malachiteum]
MACSRARCPGRESPNRGVDTAPPRGAALGGTTSCGSKEPVSCSRGGFSDLPLALGLAIPGLSHQIAEAEAAMAHNQAERARLAAQYAALLDQEAGMDIDFTLYINS